MGLLAIPFTVGIFTILDWGIYLFVKKLGYPSTTRRELVYMLLNVFCFGGEFAIGPFIENSSVLFSNWGSLLLGSEIYKTGYMLVYRDAFTRTRFRIWMSAHIINIVLMSIWIGLFQTQFIPILPSQPQWVYYWNGATITFFIYETFELFYSARDWFAFWVRTSFFVLQRLIRTPIIVLTAISYWINPYLMIFGFVPGVIIEFGNIYTESTALYRIYQKLRLT